MFILTGLCNCAKYGCSKACVTVMRSSGLNLSIRESKSTARGFASEKYSVSGRYDVTTQYYKMDVKAGQERSFHAFCVIIINSSSLHYLGVKAMLCYGLFRSFVCHKAHFFGAWGAQRSHNHM